MTSRAIAGATALLIALSTAAFAEEISEPAPGGSEKCVSLEVQFTVEVPDHRTARHLKVAEYLEKHGTTLCTEKYFTKGEADLLTALHDIGVKAKP